MINSCITVVEKEVFVHFYMIFRSKWLRWAEVTLTLKCLCHVLIQLNCEKLLKITEVCGCQPQHFELLLVKKSGLQNEFSNSKGCSRSCCGLCVSGLDKIWHFWKICSVWLSWLRRDPVTNFLQLLHVLCQLWTIRGWTWFYSYCDEQACCTCLSAFRPCNGFFRRHWGLALVYSWLRGLDRDDWLSKENWWSRQPLAITARQGCDEDKEVKDANKEKNLKCWTYSPEIAEWMEEE